VPSHAKAHQGTIVDAPDGNPATPCFFNNRRRRWSETHILEQRLQFADDSLRVVRFAGDGGADQVDRGVHRLDAELLLLVCDDHPPDIGIAGTGYAPE
jgi:hypothetical protein